MQRERRFVANLRLVLVTPEKTLFDREVASIRVPLFDGSAGFYPGRAPLVGRLGIGELRLTNGSEEESYFVEGGFVQVKGEVVSVLTNAAIPVSELSRKSAAEQLQSAKAAKSNSDEEYLAMARKLERARKMLTLAGKD